MKLSFITCTYNRSQLLLKNIESVLQQNFKNFEHYVIDDGSTDDTATVINKYKHIKYIKLNKNYGQPGAMYYSNVLKKVNGDYIMILDSDDYLLPNVKKIIEIKIAKNKNVWSFSFDILSKNRKKLNFKKEKMIKSACLYYDDHPRYNNGEGYLDFIDIKKKIFYKKFIKYFKSPKYWYSSATDVYFHNDFKEVFVNKKIAYYSFNSNNVTKGHNLDKYAPITLHTRQYIFNKFSNLMEKNYYNYHLKSLIMNQFIFPGYKRKNLKLINKEKKNFLKYKDYIIFLFLLLLPTKFLFFLKKLFKKLRKNR
jgi:glycosyltransferase involved in cell wall biosynthesis